MVCPCRQSLSSLSGPLQVVPDIDDQMSGADSGQEVSGGSTAENWRAIAARPFACAAFHTVTLPCLTDSQASLPAHFLLPDSSLPTSSPSQDWRKYWILLGGGQRPGCQMATAVGGMRCPLRAGFVPVMKEMEMSIQKRVQHLFLGLSCLQPGLSLAPLCPSSQSCLVTACVSVLSV